LILAPVGPFPAYLLSQLSRRTGIALGEPRVNPGHAWNDSRGQCDSNRILAALKEAYQGTVVGATGYDLYLPILTHVFGEAELRGRVAVFSIHRLREEFYGMPPNGDLLMDRAVRELWHELGHVFGLTHCRDAFCVMSPAHSVEQVDAKADHYCPHCVKRLAALAPEAILQRHERGPAARHSRP